MRLKEIKTINVFTRWWYDVENGNPYYARKIVVNLGLSNEKTFSIGMTWGDVDGIENDYIQKVLDLPKSVCFNRCKMLRYINHKLCEVHSIRYTYHPAKRVWKEDALDHPERFRNV